MMIDGKLVDGEAGCFTNINPATEEVLGEVADASHADMHRAIDAARRAFDETDWPTNHAFRQRCLLQLQDALESEQEELREELILEVGCPRAITHGPQLDAPLADGLRYPAKLIDEYPWETSLGDAVVSVTGMNTTRKVWREPAGVVGAIVPWNFPFEVTIQKIGQALGTGYTVLLKPAPNTPYNATRLGRLIAEKTDIPAGVVNVVTASDHFVGEELTLSPKVDLISFTGSTAVGQRIMEKGAATMKRLFLELGGKSATIVLEDADFALGCMMGIAPCMHAGQGCANPTRLLLPRSRYDEGVEILKGIYEGVAPGDPQDPGTFCGPVISDRQRSRVRGYIQKGIDEGARLVVGGPEQPDGLDKGFFVKPTLFVDVDNSMTIAQEEIFGPVLVVIPYDGRGRCGADRQRQPVRPGGQRDGRLGRTRPGRRQTPARRIPRHQRRRGLRRRHAVRRIQGQRRRPPERHRRLRSVHRSQVRRLPRLRSISVQLFDDLEAFGEFDDFVSGDVRDPYTELNRLRREEPVQKIEIPGIPGEEGKPIFMVYRYEEAQQMLRDNETFSSSIIIQAFGDVFGKHVMLGMDEPQHGRHRALVSKAFSQKALARWEDELVTKIGNALIDRFSDRGSADLVKEFNFPYPTLIIAGLLGLPQEDYAQFQKWSISLLSFTVNPERGREASQALAEYFRPILQARRQDPRDDLISGLATAEIDGEKLSDEEIFSFLRLLLPAGVETTYRSLGNLLFALLSNPDQLDAVRADRSLLPQAIEEAVRWEPPLIMITRVASRDTELGGVQIPAGCSVMPILGAANRQDERYADPNRFNIFRDVKPNIGWGHGVHVCLGMHLARLEMRVALNLLFDRLPNLRLDPSTEDPYIRGQAFRSPTSVPVLFDVPAAAARADAKAP